jgi:nucleotide-binding universal stress UspA family protein
MPDEKARILVVANRTAESEELLETLKARAAKGPASFNLVVPSTPHGVAWAADMHSGGDEADAHLQAAVQRLRDAGLEVEGQTGDPDAWCAVQDAINLTGPYDEVVVSTLPVKVSKWLKMDLPHRVERGTGLPVTHVVGTEVKQVA